MSVTIATLVAKRNHFRYGAATRASDCILQLPRSVAVEHRWKVLIVVSVAVFMASLDLFIVNIAFPDIEAEFGAAGVSTVSWVLNAYAIVFAALLVPAGRFADRIGRRRAFLWGTVGFLAGSALCGIAPSVEALIGARVLQAMGAAFLLPTSLALLLPEFPPAERGTAIGIWAAVGGVAAAAGPPLGGILVEADWRLVFLVNIPVGLLALFFAARLLVESRDPDQAPADGLGVGLLVLGVAMLVLGFVEAPDWGWGDPRTLIALLGSVPVLALFWHRCNVHPSPVVDPAMLEVRSSALANLASLLFSIAFAAMLLEGVLFLTGVWHSSVLEAGLQIAPGPAMAATFAAITGRWSERFGHGPLAATGIAIFALGVLWWIARVDATPDYPTELLPGMLVTGIGVGFVLPSLAGAATASLPPARFATGTAVYTMSRQIGFALGVAVLVAILGTPDPADPVSAFRDGWVFMAGACAPALVAALGIGAAARNRDAAPAAEQAPA
jgi:EmrB/QacA subfamily drug resistance transporter